MTKSSGRPNQTPVVDHLPENPQVQDPSIRLDLYKNAVMQYKAIRLLGNTNVSFEDVLKSQMENADRIDIDEEAIKFYEQECKDNGVRPYRL